MQVNNPSQVHPGASSRFLQQLQLLSVLPQGWGSLNKSGLFQENAFINAKRFLPQGSEIGDFASKKCSYFFNNKTENIGIDGMHSLGGFCSP